ncbi:MAG: hypothetical protein ACRD34_11860 [Bryobacteraceae bacterium]
MRLMPAAVRPTTPGEKTVKPVSRRRDWGIAAAIAAPPLLLILLIPPLQLGEILQIVGVTGLTHTGLFDWIASTPDSAPLNFLAQFPLLALFGNTRFGARILSFVFALAACYLFLRWARRIPLQRPCLALAAFLLLPLHYLLATKAQPFEQGLFLSLAATLCFFSLIGRQTVLRAAMYAGLLLLCLYTSPYSFLPAVGLLAALFVFVNRAHERRALWFVLAATAVPVLLFLPYLVWAHGHTAADWLFEPASFPAGTPTFLQPLYALAAQGWAACGLAFLFLWALAVGVWYAARWPTAAMGKRRILVCCLGAAVFTIVLTLCFDAANGRAFAARHVLWIAPDLIVAAFLGLERVGKLLRSRRPVLTGALAILALSAASDIAYLSSNPPDIGREANQVVPELTGDSCVVFVSEHYSESLFLVFQPQLAAHECMNFFHRKIVLASHPYVRPDQQSDAESFFRGLNFIERKRIHVAGGQIVVMQQKR